MKFSLQLDCDNAAFGELEDDASDGERLHAAGPEIARIMRELASRLTPLRSEGGNLYDANGNKCGYWRID